MHNLTIGVVSWLIPGENVIPRPQINVACYPLSTPRELSFLENPAAIYAPAAW